MSTTKTDKIFKILNNCTEDEIHEIFTQIKSFLSAKALAKATEYQQLADKFQEISNTINNTK